MKKLMGYKKILIVAAVLSVAGFTYAYFYPGTGTKQNKSREAFQKGFNLYNSYQYKASIDYFLEALSYNPEFSLARKMLGSALFSSGQVDEAISEWKLLSEMGVYDPSLDVHLRNILSAGMEQSENWFMKSILKPRRGFRFSYPMQITDSGRDSIILLSQGQLGVGSVIEINNNYQFISNKRRISEKLGIPAGAAGDGKELWITDLKNDKIYRLDLNDKIPVLSDPDPMGKAGNGKLEFHGPAGIAYCDGFFYVADSGNNRIQKIAADGTFNMEFSAISGEIGLRNPFGVACTPDHKIYVSEPDNQRLVVFDEYGNFLRFEGEGSLEKPRHLFYDKKRNLMIVGDESRGIVTMNLSTSEVKTINAYRDEETNQMVYFQRAYSAFIDQYGNMYVADMGTHSVYHFVPEEFLYSNLNVWVERIDVNRFPHIGIWVNVKDHLGNFILNLNPDNFQIRENNGTPGMVNLDYLNQFSNNDQWVVLVSRSARMKEYMEILHWISDFLFKDMREKDQIMTVGYSTDYSQETSWTNSFLGLKGNLTDKNKFEDEISQTPDKSGEALYWSITQLLPRRGNRSVIWITDGGLTESERIPLTQIENYGVVHNIKIHIINFQNPEVDGYKANTERLQTIAQKTGGHYFYSYENLTELKQKLREYKEKSYVISYKSPIPPNWKGQYVDLSIEVRVQGRDGKENYGYFIP